MSSEERENLFDARDRFSPSLMDLFRNKTGLTGQLLAELLRQTKGLSTLSLCCDVFIWPLFFSCFSILFPFAFLYSSLFYSFPTHSYLCIIWSHIFTSRLFLLFQCPSLLLSPLIPFCFVLFSFLPFHIAPLRLHCHILSSVLSLHVLHVNLSFKYTWCEYP